MYARIASSATFFEVLHRIDQELAADTREAGCPTCGAALHLAAYDRKPRGSPVGLSDELSRRLSLCCSREGCRRRVLPPSCLFLGRRVYWSVIVVLALALRQQRPDGHSARQLRVLFGVTRRTLVRWSRWFAEAFSTSDWWRSRRGLVPVEVRDEKLPGSLLSAFIVAAPDVDVGVERCLVFLASYRGGHAF